MNGVALEGQSRAVAIAQMHRAVCQRRLSFLLSLVISWVKASLPELLHGVDRMRQCPSADRPCQTYSARRQPRVNTAAGQCYSETADPRQ